MAYDGGHRQQGRPYAGPAAQRPINRQHPPPQQYNSNPQYHDHYQDYQDGGYYEGGHYEGGHYEGGHYEGGHYEGGHYDGAHYDEQAAFARDYAGGPQYPPPQRARPPQEEYYSGPPGRGRGAMPPPGRGGRGGHYGPPPGAGSGPGGRGFPPSGGLPAGPAPNRGGRPGPAQFQRGGLSDSAAQPRPSAGGFGGGAFPTFPGREKQSDLDAEAIILSKMAGMDVGDTARPPPGPPNRGGYGQRGPSRGPPQGPPQGPPPRRNDWDPGRLDGNGYGPPRDDFAPPMRSVTMPVGDLNRSGGFVPPRRTDSIGFNGPHANANANAHRRPSSSEVRRPMPQRQFPPDQRPPPPNGHNGQNMPNDRQQQQQQQQSYTNASAFDSPYSNPLNNAPMGDADYGVPARVNSGGHSDYAWPRGSLDESSRSRLDLNRTKSQPDLRRPQDAISETPADAPPMPLPPAAAPGPGTYQPYQPYRPGNVSAPPQPQEVPDPSSPPRPFMEPLQRPLSNPDVLPSHPVPFRPGLVNPINPDDRPAPVRNYNPTGGGGADSPSSSSSSHQKPIPVRNYNGIPASNPTPPGQSTPTQQQQQQQQKPKESSSPPVTPEELERLRLRNKAEPNDKETALALAKRLLEACDVLVPATQDPKARGRMRERFALDAQKVLKKLCHQQVPEALFLMADCLGRGAFGGEPDNKDAFTHYQSAAKLGHAAAAYRTAVCCEIGNEEGGGTRKDPLKAIQWYKRAATLGDTPAMYKVGMILLKGLLGQPRNPREAVSWLKRAAERADSDNPHALHELGLLYESASPNDAIVRDPAYALELFRQAADLGYKFSQFRLGCVYEYGLMNVPIDPRMSIMWYSKAAMQEEHQAELALSGWYLTGSEGVLGQSDAEAYLWARKAAMAGLPKAEYAMGYFTEVGIGVAPNLEDAKRWYWRAAAQDFPKARERLEDLKRSNKTAPRPRERIARNSKQQEGECVVM